MLLVKRAFVTSYKVCRLRIVLIKFIQNYPEIFYLMYEVLYDDDSSPEVGGQTAVTTCTPSKATNTASRTNMAVLSFRIVSNNIIIVHDELVINNTL